MQIYACFYKGLCRLYASFMQHYELFMQIIGFYAQIILALYILCKKIMMFYT
jgi:hypothetical protein